MGEFGKRAECGSRKGVEKSWRGGTGCDAVRVDDKGSHQPAFQSEERWKEMGPEGEKGLQFRRCVRSYTVGIVSFALRQHYGSKINLRFHRSRCTISLATFVLLRGICSVRIFRDAVELHGNVFLGVARRRAQGLT